MSKICGNKSATSYPENTMNEILLNGAAKEKIFEAVLDAENNYLRVICEGFEGPEESTGDELCFYGVYRALYVLCRKLGLEDVYIEWRSHKGDVVDEFIVDEFTKEFIRQQRYSKTLE